MTLFNRSWFVATAIAVTGITTMLAIPKEQIVSAAPDELSAEARLIPPDAAFFVHVDFAALYDSKLGDAVRNTKSAELKDKLDQLTRQTGVKLADIKTLTFVLPKGSDNRDLQRGLVAVRFRKEYDRKAVLNRVKEEASKSKNEFSEKDGIARVLSNAFGKQTTVYDVTDSQRLIVLNDLPETYLKPAATSEPGVHTDTIKKATTAQFVLGVNFNILPDEIRGENLPAEIRPFQPILKADTLAAIGTLSNEKIDLAVRVRTKNKSDASEVEKSLAAVQTLAALGIPQAKKQLSKDLSDTTGMVKLLDAVEKMASGAKFSVEDKEAVATISAPTDTPIGPLLEMMAGGGASARMQSSNNLKQLAIAMHNYNSACGFFPPAASLGKKGKKMLSWRVEVLPYIEHEALYKKFKLDEPWDSEHNLKVFQDNPMPNVFAIPGTKNGAEKKTHYQVFVGNGAMFETVTGTKITDIQDGTSNTILVATAATPVEWTKPDDIEFDPKADVKKLLLIKDKVTLIAFGDGSVRAVSETVSEVTLKALVTRSGGEVVGNDFE